MTGQIRSRPTILRRQHVSTCSFDEAEVTIDYRR
jgi:hypothetical protein